MSVAPPPGTPPSEASQEMLGETKKGPAIRAFHKVTGTGFEPVTFGLWVVT